jgi:hypothetical protein
VYALSLQNDPPIPAVAARPLNLVGLAASKPWPRCVPDSDAAIAALVQSRPVLPSLAMITERVKQGCAPLCRQLFAGKQFDFDERTLIAMVALRWRLTVAEAVQDGWAGEIDGGALEALLAETDSTLKEAVPPPSGNEAIQRAFDTERQALVRAGVNLVQHGRRIEAQVVQRALSRAVLPEETIPGTGSYKKLFVLGLALAIAAAVSAYTHVDQRALASAQGPLPGTLASGTASDAVKFIHTANGAAFDPSELSQLRAQAAAEGRSFRQLGPGEVLFGPATAAQAKGDAR